MGIAASSLIDNNYHSLPLASSFVLSASRKASLIQQYQLLVIVFVFTIIVLSRNHQVNQSSTK